ncbi:MAG: formate dehydrogenase accessory protein FdhE [Coriobacteriia bacterium]|nr:formate dehydrogenase accessory protein FdhE [Coriobacteriia bacterium]
MDLSQSKKALENNIEELGKPYVSFFTGLWDLEESIEPVDWTPAEPEKLTEAMKNGTVAFSLEAPSLTQKYVLDNVESSLAYIGLYVKELTEVSKKLTELRVKYDEGELSLSEKMLESLFTEPEQLINELAKQLDVPAESEAYHYISLAVVTVLEPTATHAASKIEIPKEPGFKTGNCPVCGSPTTIGVLKDEGAAKGSPRALHCSFCGSSWNYPRIKCTRCGSTNPEDLTFHFDEKDMNKRIYRCKKCGGTQKIMLESLEPVKSDLRANELLMLPLEEAVLKAK